MCGTEQADVAGCSREEVVANAARPVRRESSGHSPFQRLGNQVLLALAPGGALLAVLAVVVGVACAVAVGVTLQASLAISKVHQTRDDETRIVEFNKANTRLMGWIEGLSSGYRTAPPGRFPVQEAWREFDKALTAICDKLDPAIPNIELLRQTCLPSDTFRATVGPALQSFDPPSRPLAPAAWQRLQMMRDNVESFVDYVLTHSGAFEDELEGRYRDALAVLVASVLGFAVSTAALLFVVVRASSRYVAKWREATLQHAQLESVVGSSGAPILLVDRDLRMVLANREFRKLGLDMTTGSSNAFKLDGELLGRWRQGALSPELRQPARYATDILDAEGRQRFFSVTATPIVDKDGLLQQIAFVAVDDTDHRQAQEALIEGGRYDALTGLPNRNHFIERARQAIGEASSHGAGYAMFSLDLDDFNDINDALGYAIGDGLLKTATERIRATLRERDLASRFGADEFIILRMDVKDEADAGGFARDLLDALARPFMIDGNTIRSTASSGIAMHDATRPVPPEILVGRAGMALHRAKTKGRNGYAFFTDAIDEEVRSRVWLAQDMREGLALGQFFLVYQPRIDTVSRRVTGMEALLRWRHPTRGLLMPKAFIPIAESTGVIQELGQWVVHEACRQTRRWLDAGLDLGRMAVNVSALQFKAPEELERDIEAALAEAALSMDKLELELTETALMEVSREHNDLLQRLRARGIRISIDDFGIGYSSLDYLRRLPVDRIKIAQEFVHDVADRGADATITRIAVLLGRALGLEVLAEGVETDEQLATLRRWGCREVQGYLFAEPMTADQVAPFLVASGLLDRDALGPSVVALPRHRWAWRSTGEQAEVSISAKSVTIAGEQLKRGLERLAEGIFRTMVPDLPVSQAMREFGAGVLTSGVDDNADFDSLGSRTVEIMLGNGNPPRSPHFAAADAPEAPSPS
jgi:diguanylate cyclase (GGDEF)-like protein